MLANATMRAMRAGLVPFPEFSKWVGGRGALRGWLEIAYGKVEQVTSDLALADVQAQLGEGLKPLDLHSLRGRIAWGESEQGFEVSTRQLTLKTDV